MRRRAWCWRARRAAGRSSKVGAENDGVAQACRVSTGLWNRNGYGTKGVAATGQQDQHQNSGCCLSQSSRAQAAAQ